MAGQLTGGLVVVAAVGMLAGRSAAGFMAGELVAAAGMVVGAVVGRLAAAGAVAGRLAAAGAVAGRLVAAAGRFAGFMAGDMLVVGAVPGRLAAGLMGDVVARVVAREFATGVNPEFVAGDMVAAAGMVAEAVLGRSVAIFMAEGMVAAPGIVA